MLPVPDLLHDVRDPLLRHMGHGVPNIDCPVRDRGTCGWYYEGRLYRILETSCISDRHPLLSSSLVSSSTSSSWEGNRAGLFPPPLCFPWALCGWNIPAPRWQNITYFFGYRRQPYDQPVRTNRVTIHRRSLLPRDINIMLCFFLWTPRSPAKFQSKFGVCIRSRARMHGVLPFGACVIELLFIFSPI